MPVVLTTFLMLKNILCTDGSAYGANGYLLKSSDPDEIKDAIFSIYNNGMYYSDTATAHFFRAVKTRILSYPTLLRARYRC